MQLTIHRGTHEIGGNCVELSAGATRLIIDVGMPLVGADREPFDALVMRGKDVTQLLAEGILPSVPGLFGDGPAPDAILLSHAHMDHTGLLGYTRPEIPVYASEGTSAMMLAGSIFAGQPKLDRDREKRFDPEEAFEIGDFTITAHRVDHSAFDSMAFIVEADGKRLLYSGDLRLHGRKPGMARQLVRAATQQPIDVMLMEGTHFGAERESGITEEELEQVVHGHIHGAGGLVMAMFSPMHVDRLVTFYKAARRCGRTFVLDPYAAFVMWLVAQQCKIPAPTAEAGIRVYYNRHFEETYDQRNLKKIHRMFSRDRIEMDEILAAPRRHAMIFRTSMLERDFGGSILTRSRCIYSYWPGYLDKPEWGELQQELDSAGGDFIQAHTSGHIFADDTVQFVKSIEPRQIIPIHTFEPTAFEANFSNVIRLNDGEPMHI